MQKSLTEVILNFLPDELAADVASLDFRRSPAGPADAIVAFRSRVEQLVDLPKHLGARDEVGSVIVKSNELKIRLKDSFIAEYSAAPSGQRSFEPTRPPARVRVAFCDPNLNKALHVGHLRNVALGHSIASLRTWYGDLVTSQSVACDIGRNMAEALAGLTLCGASVEQAFAERLDRKLGHFYSRYVLEAAIDEAQVNGADRMIARELEVQADAADQTLDLWRAGDAATRDLWDRVVNRILNEQAQTLRRLGVALDTVVLESEALAGEAELVEQLTVAGIARLERSGAIVIDTGRPDYPHCPIRRADGFPTEHLRALGLWMGLSRDEFDETIHIMGDEWRTSTDVRVEVLDRLLGEQFKDHYTIVPHALIRFGASTMKSSTGNVLLIDDLLDLITAEAARKLGDVDESQADRAIRAAAMVPLISAPADQIIEVVEATFADLERNLGWNMSRIAATSSCVDRLPPIDGSCPTERYLVLQRERLYEAIRRASLTNDPLIVVRFCRHLIEFGTRFKLSERALAWRAGLMDDALSAIGIKSCSRQPVNGR